MKNNQLIIKILFIVLGAVLFLTSLSLFIQSIYVYDGGFEANQDYVVSMLISAIILVYTIYNLKGKKLREAKNYVILSTSIIISAYSLGKFIKALVKGKKFVDNQVYLYAGLVALVLLLIGIFEYLDIKKNNK